MSIINTGSYAKALWPGVNKWFGTSYNEHPLEFPQIFDEETSTKAYEEDVQDTGFGLMPLKPEGTSILYDSKSQGFVQRYVHATYAMGFIVTEEAIEDDQYDVVAKKRAQALAYSARQTQEIVAANILNRAFNGAFPYADGTSLINNGNVQFSGGTWSNVIATPADLSELALEQLCIQIMQATDDRGLRIAIMPKKLIIPPGEVFNAARILKSVQQNDTANNAINALRESGMFRDGYVVNHYLTDTDAWFVKTDVPNGLTTFKRKGLTFAIDNDFDTSNAKFKASFRRSWGASDKRAIFGSPGA